MCIFIYFELKRKVKFAARRKPRKWRLLGFGCEELFCKMATRRTFVNFFLHKLSFRLPLVVSGQSAFFFARVFIFWGFYKKIIEKYWKFKILGHDSWSKWYLVKMTTPGTWTVLRAYELFRSYLNVFWGVILTKYHFDQESWPKILNFQYFPIFFL